MTDEIKVHVVQRKNRNTLYLRYTDPVTGQRFERSSGTRIQRDAQKAAGRWQAELNSGEVIRTSAIRWTDFKDEFEDIYLSAVSEGYANNVRCTLNVIDETLKPDRLSRISSKWLTRFRNKVRNTRSESTVHKYFQHLHTILKWAVGEGYIKTVPQFPKAKKNAGKAKKAKGRPITLEEFERMLEKAPTDSLRHLMRGFWLSALRLGEALALTWDRWADGIRIQIDGPDVFLLIDSESQKNREVIQYPVVDDFAAFLLKTPREQREGFVFDPTNVTGRVSRRVDSVSDWIVATGEAARVKVDERQTLNKDGQSVTKTVWASAHDFRRAFGTRWADLVPPKILRDLMRHASVTTTEQFYLTVNGKETLAAIRRYQSKVNSEVNNDASEVPATPET